MVVFSESCHVASCFGVCVCVCVCVCVWRDSKRRVYCITCNNNENSTHVLCSEGISILKIKGAKNEDLDQG